MSKKLSIFLLLAMFITTSAHAEMWKMGHIRPSGTPEDIASKEFAADVKKLTDGKLNVTVFPDSQLGDWTVVQQRISMGAVEMALQPQDTQVDKRLSILFFPYLFTSLEQVGRNMTPGHPFRKEIEDMFLKQNIIALAFWPSFFGGLALKELPENWAVPGANKGIKVRVPNDPSFVSNVQAMGYLATPIAFSDTFPALQTGVVDGILGSGAVGYYSNFRDIVKYYLPINDHLEIYTVMVSKDAFDALDKETQAKVRQAAAAMEKKRYSTFAADEAKYRKMLEEAGVKTVEVTPEIIAGFAKSAKEKCWPELTEKIDPEYITKLLKMVEQ